MTINVGIDIAKQVHFRVGLSDVVGRIAGLPARTGVRLRGRYLSRAVGAIGRTTYA